MTELKKEKALQRQRLETELQAIHRLINIAIVQDALRKALTSAVAALGTIAKPGTSKKHLPEEKPESANQVPPSKETAPGDSC